MLITDVVRRAQTGTTTRLPGTGPVATVLA